MTRHRPPFSSTRRQFALRDAREAFRSALCSLLAVLLALGPVRPVWGSVDQSAPAESFSFGDTTPATHAALDTTRRKQAATRRVPVSSSGSFAQNIPIDVPPGRGAMTPALVLSYDSANAQRPSNAGLGWNLATRQVSRSTRLGFPPVKPASGSSGSEVPVYDDDKAIFDAPSGELVRGGAGVTGPSAFEGALYAPLRESEPVRFGFVQDSSGGRWVEHDPSGIKRYYGKDPFTGAEAKIKNELGEYAWLLLREEDPFGNDITYEYKNASDAARPNPNVAQSLPILSKVSWGGNRLTSAPAQFVVSTTVGATVGPIDLLHGNTILSDYITLITVGTPSQVYWRYLFTYETSKSTGRLLLDEVERVDFGAYPTSRRWKFTYEPGGPAFDPSDSGWQPIDSLDLAYKQWLGLAGDLYPARAGLAAALDAPGFRSGSRFLDYDGDGRPDAIYHGAGLGTTQSQPLVNRSRFGCASGTPCFSPASALPQTRGSELADLDGDGDLELVGFGETVDLCPVSNKLIDAGNAAVPYGDPGAPFIVTNTSRTSGLSLPASIDLPNWPYGVGRYATVTIAKELTSFCFLANDVKYQKHTPTIFADFEAPLVDLDGDGRSDLALLKSYKLSELDFLNTSACFRVHEGQGSDGVYSRLGTQSTWRLVGQLGGSPDMRVSRAFSLSPELTDRIAALPVEDLPIEIKEEIERRNPRFVNKVVAGPSRFIRLPRDLVVDVILERGGIVHYDVPATSPSPPYVPLSGTYDLGGEGFFDGDIFMPDPEAELPGYGPPFFLTGDGIAPLGPGASSGSSTGCAPSESFPQVWQFNPKAYLSRGTTVAFDDAAASWFTASLQQATTRPFTSSIGQLDLSIGFCGWGLCVFANGCPLVRPTVYPTQSDFNSFFLDVNGDGLPDLVLAEPPVNNVCVGGHRVLINRGYRFEARNPDDRAPSTWSASPYPKEAWSGPLFDLRNRSNRCASSAPDTLFEDKQQTAAEVQASIPWTAPDRPDAFGFPMSAASFVDIDADGLVDVVLAQRIECSPALAQCDFANGVVEKKKILRNLGWGFFELPGSAVSAILPGDFHLTLTQQIPIVDTDGTKVHSAWRNLTMPDEGRIVDLDGDGLVDLVKPGVACSCKAGMNGCQDAPASWKRNLGKVPDLLTRVDAPLGAYTEISYGPANGSNVTYAAGGLHPPPSMRVVTHVHIGAGPGSLPGAPPPQDITLHYENYVRDPVSNEHLGFEVVRAEFANSFAGEARETVTVEQVFDVHAEVDGISARHPLKGALVETTTTSSDSPDEHVRTAATYALTPLGAGVRVRPLASFKEECKGQSCSVDGTETTAFDELGYPTDSMAGDGDGTHVTAHATRRAVAYQHLTGPWILGLVTAESMYGDAISIAGTVTPDTLLAHTVNTYYDNGLLRTSSRPGFQATGCEWAGTDDTVTLEYDGDGLPRKTISARGRVETISYAADRLYADTKTTSVTRYVDGVVTGTTTLTGRFEFDRRTGKQTSIQDSNGTKLITLRDSLGRPRIELIGFAGTSNVATLRETTYDDDDTPVIETTTHRDSGAYFQEQTHLDAAGHVLGVVELVDGVYTRKTFDAHDAFGRVVESALPAATTSFSDYVVASDTRRSYASTDGFDRVRSHVRPDGGTTTYAYSPRVTVETNPRGYETLRDFDWRGDVVWVERRGTGGAVLSAHAFTRDSLGRIAQVDDADGTIRRFERDLGGRLRRATLPHFASASPLVFSYCHDVEDKLVASATPDGRNGTLTLDELGRPVESTSTRGPDAVTTYHSYDDPSRQHGLGRMTRTSDDSGVTTLDYDDLGRPLALSRDLPASLTSGVGVPSHYEMGFDYDFAGNLTLAYLRATGGFGGQTIALHFVRDGKGRATHVESGGGAPTVVLVDQVGFDAADRMTSARFSSGVTATWDYDPVTQWLASIDYSAGSAQVGRVEYDDYDANGNMRLEARFAGGIARAEKSHTYDALDRLATSTLLLPGLTKQEAYSYSPAGNVATAGPTTYTYARADLPQAATSLKDGASGPVRALTYDDDGQLVVDATSNGSRTLRWNPAGCLTDVEALISTHLVCDASGNTVARQTIEGGTVTRSSIDIGGLGEVRPEEGVFFLRLPVNGTVLVEEARSLATGARIADRTGYILADARGSVLARTSFAGAAVDEEAEYDAWGATMDLGAGLDTPLHQFTGVEPDPGTGHYHFGVRAYDPTLRRWLSADPALMVRPEKGTFHGELLNLYAYASNDPVGKVDATGEEPGDAAARGSGALVYGLKAAADQKKEDQKAAKENGLWVGAGAALVFVAGVVIPEVALAWSARATSSVAGRAAAGAAGAQVDPNVRQAEVRAAQPVVQTAARVVDKAANAAKSFCFAAGTLVHTEQGLKPIEEARPGDAVWGEDETTGEVALRRVARTFMTPEQPVVEVILEDEHRRAESVHATLEHPFLTQRGWTGASALVDGDFVLQRSGAWSRVMGVHETGERVTVYNFEVEGFHTYFVGEQGLLVHNASDVLGAAREAIATLPEKLFKPMQCDKCARAISDVLTARGIPHERLAVQANGGNEFMASDLVKKGGTTITTNGYHEFVRVGDTVFDNFLRGGVPYDIYVKALHAPQGWSWVTPK
ncbi:MAG: polymorphic toxin-type HINT domain-containing protein [Minicystis sp.]